MSEFELRANLNAAPENDEHCEVVNGALIAVIKADGSVRFGVGAEPVLGLMFSYDLDKNLGGDEVRNEDKLTEMGESILSPAELLRAIHFYAFCRDEYGEGFEKGGKLFTAMKYAYDKVTVNGGEAVSNADSLALKADGLFDI